MRYMGSRPVHFLLIVILLFPPAMYGQDRIPGMLVTISPRNRTINQVLDEITLQTGYFFTYDASLIEGGEKSRFSVTDLPLEETLDSLLQDHLVSYRVIDRNIVIYRRNENAPTPVETGIDRPLLSGRVVDSRSGKPLSYATIALNGTSLGSVTNEEGDFSFKLPTEIPDPLLVVSYLGYKSLALPVNYPLEKEMTIRLEKETIPLQEVIIRYTDPVQLLTEALERISDNYLQDHAAMTAYYRESVRRNERCMIFSEAVLDVAKGPYKPGSSGDQVRIRKGRKITDLSAEDTVIIKLHSGVYTCLSLDIIKMRPDFLSEDFMELYDMEFTDMMTYGDRLVYVIDFNQKEHIRNLMFRGSLYLDQETLAILAADFEFNPQLIQQNPELFLIRHSPRIRIRPIMARYHVDYRNYEGRYHISQARGELEMKVRKRRRWIGARYRIAIEMAVTGVEPGRQLRISRADRARPKTVLSDEPFEFDPLFWGIYNTIRPEATLMESLKLIEHNLQEITE